MNRKKATGCFADTFGNEWALENLETELTFFRRLVMITSAFIVGSRRSVPATAIKQRKIENRKVFQFNKDDFCGGRCLAKLSGCNEALKLGYLKEFVINISNNEQDHADALEVYTLRFAYGAKITMNIVNAEGIPLFKEIQFLGAEHVHESTMLLIRGLTRLFRLLSELPANCFTTFRASFYHNVPLNFTMLGWYDGKKLYSFEEEPLEVILGDVHHRDMAACLSVKTRYAHPDVNVSEAINSSVGQLDTSLSSSIGDGAKGILNETVNSVESLNKIRPDDVAVENIVNDRISSISHVIIDSASSTPAKQAAIESQNRKRPASKSKTAGKKAKISRTYRSDRVTPGVTRAPTPE